MKQFLMLLMLVSLLIACGKSREEKAAIFAEQEIKKNLYYPDTYESVDIKVDSAFYGIAMDPVALKAASRISEINDKIGNAKSRYDSEKSSLARWSGWSGPFMTSYGKEQVRQAKERMEEIERNLADWNDEIAENTEIIKKRKAEITGRDFCGWGILHRYRYGNDSGRKNIYDCMLIVDPDFKNLIFAMSLEEGSLDMQTIKILDSIVYDEE